MADLLVIQLERIGDLVQSVPLLHALHGAHPQAGIDVLVSAGNEAVLDGLPGLNRVHTIEADTAARLSAAIEAGRAGAGAPREGFAVLEALALPAYQRVVNLSHHQFGCWVAGRIDCKVVEGGVIDRQGRWVYHGDWPVYLVAMLDFRLQNGFNLVDIYRGSARAAPGLPQGMRPRPTGTPCRVELPEGPKVALNPGASRPHRCWPADRFAQLADALAERGIATVLVGAPADRAVCEQVARSCRRAPINLAGETSVPEMLDLLARMDVLVSNDTGAVHMAAAVNTPVVGIYGASWFRELAPWGAGHLVLQAPLDPEAPDWSGITPELVLAAVLDRLEAEDAGRLRRCLAGAGVACWETDFLPDDVDPLGGVTYRPRHAAGLDPQDVFLLLQRHVFAWEFSGRRGPLSHRWVLDEVLRGGLALNAWDGSQLQALSARLEDCRERLDGLGALTSEAVRLCRTPDETAVAQVRSITGRLSRGLDSLDALASGEPALRPVLSFLSWEVKMLSEDDPVGLFRGYGKAFERADRLLEATWEQLGLFCNELAEADLPAAAVP